MSATPRFDALSAFHARHAIPVPDRREVAKQLRAGAAALETLARAARATSGRYRAEIYEARAEQLITEAKHLEGTYE